MSTVSARLLEIFSGLDNAKKAVNEIELSEQIGSFLAVESEELDEREIAEAIAFQFATAENESREPWGSYFVPLGSRTQDKKTIYYPDAAAIKPSIIEYWKTRLASVENLTLKARYADLVWEFSKIAGAEKPHIHIAQTACDSYINAVNDGTAVDEHQAWGFLSRALEIALRISDMTRVISIKKSMFLYFENHRRTNKKFMWWRLSEIVWDHPRCPLDLGEEGTIVSELESLLLLTGNSQNPEWFDPWAALALSDRLVSIYQKKNLPPDSRRVTKQAGTAFEQAASDASGMLAIAWMQEILPRYRALAMREDIVRAEKIIRDRSVHLEEEIQTIETSVEVPKDKIEKWLEEMLSDNFQTAVQNIAGQFVLSEKNAEETILNSAKHAVISSLLTIDIVSREGHTVAKVGSVEEDMEGRKIHQAAQTFMWESHFLIEAFARLKRKYDVNPEALTEIVMSSPIFLSERREYIFEGIRSWMDGDYLKSIHILIPQIEAALRELLRMLGGSVMQPGKHGGFDVVTFGVLLGSEIFKSKMNKNLRFHLRALFTDSRGLNLRNRIAHGLLHYDEVSENLANLIVHGLLRISMLGYRESEAQ